MEKRGLLLLLVLGLFLIGCETETTTTTLATTTTEPVTTTLATTTTEAAVTTTEPVEPTTPYPGDDYATGNGTADVVLERKAFLPNAVETTGSVVIIVSDEEKFHKIACYNSDSIRIFNSDNLYDGEEVVLDLDPGDYRCVDAIFGARMTIKVFKSNQITGNAIIDPEKIGNDSPVMFFIALVILGIIFYFTSKARSARAARS